jgi:poly(3-hydroxybutyrate) depolymerase
LFLATLLLFAAAIVAALFVTRPHGLSHAWAAARHGIVRHITTRRLVGLPYQTITLSVRSTPSGDAALLEAIADLPLTRMMRIGYRAHDGSWRKAIVLAPRHDPHGLPLVIAPHGRGGDAAHACAVWGDLPGYARVAVVCADDPGRATAHYAWGDPGTIRDLARLPTIVAQALPGLVRARAIYAVGDSMGGQEVLLLMAAQPRLLRGAVAMDPTTNLALRYSQLAQVPNGLRDWQPLMRLEVGGTPSQIPLAYAARSPIDHLHAIASSDVPLEVWWSLRDRAVPTKPGTQAQDFIGELAEARPRAIVCQRMGWWVHGWPWRHSVWDALRFLGLLHVNLADMRAPGRLSIVAPGRTDGQQPSCAG